MDIDILKWGLLEINIHHNKRFTETQINDYYKRLEYIKNEVFEMIIHEISAFDKLPTNIIGFCKKRNYEFSNNFTTKEDIPKDRPKYWNGYSVQASKTFIQCANLALKMFSHDKGRLNQFNARISDIWSYNEGDKLDAEMQLAYKTLKKG